MFHWFSFPSFCFKNVSWHDMQTKNFQQLQPECQHVAHHVHYRNYSQTAKSPKRVHITSLVNIVQQCSPVAHDKDWPKNRDGKRTGHRHGKQTNSSKPSRRDNRSTQGPHPSIRNKRTVQRDNCRKVQRPSVGANWIPGGHLRFQRLSNSKP